MIKIVREKYFHTSSFTDQKELQAFLSDLYVFLVDEMHKGLNKVPAYLLTVPITPQFKKSCDFQVC